MQPPQIKLPGSAFAQSFGSEAARYDTYRPSYPDAAVDWALAGVRTRTVVDLGAGTGKLTAALTGRADRVEAIDPDEAMLNRLRAVLPGVRATVGSAEATGLEDASVDAVLAGQAFHWFARPGVDRELARILRPGGVVGLLWNFPDRNVAWITELYRTIGDGSPPWTHTYDDLEPADFEPAYIEHFRSGHRLAGPDALRSLVQTWSWVITRPADERTAIDDRVRALIERTPALQSEVVTMPQTTKVVRVVRR